MQGRGGFAVDEILVARAVRRPGPNACNVFFARPTHPSTRWPAVKALSFRMIKSSTAFQEPMMDPIVAPSDCCLVRRLVHSGLCYSKKTRKRRTQDGLVSILPLKRSWIRFLSCSRGFCLGGCPPICPAFRPNCPGFRPKCPEYRIVFKVKPFQADSTTVECGSQKRPHRVHRPSAAKDDSSNFGQRHESPPQTLSMSERLK